MIRSIDTFTATCDDTEGGVPVPHPCPESITISTPNLTLSNATFAYYLRSIGWEVEPIINGHTYCSTHASQRAALRQPKDTHATP